MPKKPTKTPKKKQAPIKVLKQARKDLPLDDPRWLPLIEALKLRSPQPEFATFDLLADLENNKLRCMRRSLTNPKERERVVASFWSGIEIEANHNTGRIQIYRGPAQAVEAHYEFEFGDTARVHRGYFRDPQTRLDEGWAFFVWKPDFDRRWPQPQQHEPTAETEERRGRDPKFTAVQLAAFQKEYRDYKREHPVLKKETANEHLRDRAKKRFNIDAHPDTIRDRIMMPVDEADELEK
jgi:hypothetical protein